MRFPPRASCLLAVLAISFLIPAAVPVARATTHVVISEFATRGPAAATDEFVELYNPTDSAIDISGWKLQYSSTTNGTVWSDRVILPANSSIAARGFVLLANTSYAGAVTPDYTSGLWTSGTGMADNGHERIIDASAVEVDKVGWGTAVNPEGGVAAPNHGTSANGNSVERKAMASSTADSLAAGGLHAALGNGQDTNVNGSDFVTQTHGRNPQNSASPPEPTFSSGGSGTGRADIEPAVMFTSRPLDSLRISFAQDSAYTVPVVAILVPADWTWSHNVASVVLAGSAFAGATPWVSTDTLFIGGATLGPADSGTVTIADLTSPPTKGNSTFVVLTLVSGGPLAPILRHPRVRVLDLVPIVVVHVNDASGVATAPYGVGAEATVTGIVTANLSDVRTDVYVQDGTAGIDLFSTSLPITFQPGDSITVTGSILQFRGLAELQPDFGLLTVHATGRPVPDPMVIACADVNATFQPDYTEPNEGRLVRVNGATYNATTSTITDASGTTNIFIPITWPPVPSVFDVIGILKQYKPGTPAPGPPYTADYEISPRTPADIIPHAGPIILTTPYEDNIQPTSVQLHWTTDVPSSSIVHYGLTLALGDSLVDSTPVSTHVVTVSGLTPATVYAYSVGSGDGNGTNFAPTQLFSTASPAQSTGQMNVYFNKSVNTSVASIHLANGNQDLPALLVSRIDNARRSIDAALYNLSGTPGSTLAAALINAKNRGVQVRVICEEDNKGTAAFNSITSGGIPLITDRFDATNNGLGLMHNKFLVIDGRAGAAESVWVWTGSWNPTDPGTNNDMQNAIEIQDQALANAYTLEFNEMWGSNSDVPNASSSRFGARKLDDTPHKFAIGGHDVECYFSPSDGVTSRILSTLNAAQHSIGFQVLTLTRSDIAGALVAKHLAGVSVRGDLDNGTDTGSEYSYLVSNGVDVHLKTGVSGLLHHKYCLVDAENPNWDAMTLTGSHNWSSAAENSNNENTLIVHDPDVTNQYLQEFVARYYQFGGADSVVVGVEQIDARLPHAVSLAQNYPNPFRGETHIVYAIPSAANVVLRLYDVQGREVRTLVNERQAPGRYRVDLSARGFASGVYFYRLEVGSAVQQRKMLNLR